MPDRLSQSPIRIRLGPRPYSAGDLFLGVLALLVLDAIVAWIAWSAYTHAVYLIAAIFLAIAVLLAALGLWIKRRANADRRRRHQARLLLETIGPETPDEQLDQIVDALLTFCRASRDDPRLADLQIVEQLEHRLARPIPRLWIINDAEALRPRQPLPLRASGPPKIDLTRWHHEPALPDRPAIPHDFGTWPARSGTSVGVTSQTTRGGALLAAAVCLLMAFVFMPVQPLLTGPLIAIGLLIFGLSARAERMKPGRWAISATDSGCFVVQLRRGRVIEAHPIDERSLVIVRPAMFSSDLAFARRMIDPRIRVIQPGVPGVFEADGVDLHPLAAGLGLCLDQADKAPTSTVPPEDSPASGFRSTPAATDALRALSPATPSHATSGSAPTHHPQ